LVDDGLNGDWFELVRGCTPNGDEFEFTCEKVYFFVLLDK
jgi:hypothetical protein